MQRSSMAKNPSHTGGSTSRGRAMSSPHGARVLDRPVALFRLPIWTHTIAAWVFERTMVAPLVALAQVRVLAEGVTVPPPAADPLPDDLLPTTPFTEEQIRRGL